MNDASDWDDLHDTEGMAGVKFEPDRCRTMVSPVGPGHAWKQCRLNPHHQGPCYVRPGDWSRVPLWHVYKGIRDDGLTARVTVGPTTDEPVWAGTNFDGALALHLAYVSSHTTDPGAVSVDDDDADDD